MHSLEQTLKQALDALGSNRTMAVDSQGNYTKEVTPKKTLDAITALNAAINAPPLPP